ncbi:MAG: antitoxin VapB family protein [Candidatus Woesearchaeota archaeon]
MGTKTITITNDAYDSIKGLKSETESFSHLFIRLSKEKSIADKYFGILKGDVEETKRRFKTMRKEMSTDFEERKNVLFRH